MSVTDRFSKLYSDFCDDMTGAFPEIVADIKKAAEVAHPAAFYQLLNDADVQRLIARDSNVVWSIPILPGVSITKSAWERTSDTTHKAVFDYVIALQKLSLQVSPVDVDSMFDEMAKQFASVDFKESMASAAKMMASAASATDSHTRAPSTSAPSASASSASAADPSAVPFPDIPSHLQNGIIAKIAQELMGEFKPEDLGIDPSKMETMNPLQVFEYMQETYTKNPAILLDSLKRVTKKIQAKFQRGDFTREQLMAEAQELMGTFSQNEMFKGLFENLSQMTAGGGIFGTGTPGAGAPSERRAAVQERLRKKLAEKQTKRQTPGKN